MCRRAGLGKLWRMSEMISVREMVVELVKNVGEFQLHACRTRAIAVDKLLAVQFWNILANGWRRFVFKVPKKHDIRGRQQLLCLRNWTCIVG